MSGEVNIIGCFGSGSSLILFDCGAAILRLLGEYEVGVGNCRERSPKTNSGE
jgi:hypothetical protein